MKKLLTGALAALLLLALPTFPTFAASGTSVIDGYLDPAGYVQLTSLGTAVSLGTIPAGARMVLIQAQDQNVRWRDDGTDPTSSAGMVIEAGQTLVYIGRLSSVKLIETTASAKVNVTFYK